MAHQTAAFCSMACVRYSDTEQKYNEYFMPAISAGQRPVSPKETAAVHRLELSARDWEHERQQMIAPIFSQDRLQKSQSRHCVRGIAYASYFVSVCFLTPLISVIVRAF